MLARLLREPLVHFLLIGALLFVVYTLLNPTTGNVDERRIVVSQAIVDRLIEAWTRQWQRPPDPAELAGLVDAHIREEVLYREALALGLEQDDTIIRRRLAQKMEFLTEDLAVASEPSDAELRAFYREHESDFAEPARLSFDQVYLNPDKRGPDLQRDAQLMLTELQAANVTDATDRGDSFLLQSSYRYITPLDTNQLFGQEFTAALFQLNDDGWQGPIRSGFGLHLVRVTEREAARVPPFEEIAERVRVEYDYARRKRADQAIFDDMKARYEIVIETPGDGAAAT